MYKSGVDVIAVDAKPELLGAAPDEGPGESGGTYAAEIRNAMNEGLHDNVCDSMNKSYSSLKCVPMNKSLD